MSDQDYVHGYTQREKDRLHDQAGTLTDLLHSDTHYPAGARVLEAGCGVGAQTVILAHGSPDARITSIDISADSLAQAQKLAARENLTNVQFQQADIFNLPFHDATFDHIFVCFVLEHLSAPAGALSELRRVLKPTEPSPSSKATMARSTSTPKIPALEKPSTA
jgi:ubiquinone/menaquinone biosynthesis C-methylase UbiE